MLDNQLIIIGSAVIAGIVIMYLLNSCESEPLPPASRSTPSTPGDLEYDISWGSDGTIRASRGGLKGSSKITDYITSPSTMLTEGVTIRLAWEPILDSKFEENIYYPIEVYSPGGRLASKALAISTWGSADTEAPTEFWMERSGEIWSFVSPDEAQLTHLASEPLSRACLIYDADSKLLIFETGSGASNWYIIKLGENMWTTAGINE